MDKLRIYNVEMNPYGHRVLLILDAKQANYEVYKLDPNNLPEWFKAKNPKLKIPILETPPGEGDRYIYESVVIADYLDEKYEVNPLHSTDPYIKAQDRLLIERFNELIKGTLDWYDTNFAFGSERIIATVELLEKELGMRGTEYFSGISPGMMDYMIWPWVERLYVLKCINGRKFEEKKDQFPNFVDWGEQMQRDPVVRKHACSPEEYFEYYKNARSSTLAFYL